MYPTNCTSLENNVNTTINVLNEIKNKPIKIAQIRITGKNTIKNDQDAIKSHNQ